MAANVTFKKIDQKVGKVVTGAPSYTHCIFCHKNQSDFNKENMKFEVIDDLVKYGLSTLHFGNYQPPHIWTRKAKSIAAY